MGRKQKLLGAATLLALTGCPSITLQKNSDRILTDSASTKRLIRIIAGVKTGELNIKEIENGYDVKGTFEPGRPPKAFYETLKAADYDGDGEVTRQEAHKHRRKVYPRYASRNR